MGDSAPPASRFATALPAVVLLAFVAGRCLVPMDETDLFFNLRLGEQILATHTVPTSNLFSFTYPDAPDVNLAWVFQILLAAVHRAGGVAGAVLLKTTFVVATFAVLYRVARQRGADPVVAALSLSLAAWAAEPRFVERSHLVTFLGLALLLAALARAERGQWRVLIAFVPGGLVWANANSCFALAPIVLGLYALGAWLERPARIRDARRAALLGLALLPLIFATPSGTGALRYLANHIRMPWLRPLQEYRTWEWPLDAPVMFLLFGIAAAATAVLWQSAPRRWAVRLRTLPWRHAFPVLALAVLGARRIRFVAETALLGGPLLAELAAGALRPLAARWRVRNVATGLAVVGLSALTIVPRLERWRDGIPVMNLSLEPGLVPFEAIAFVERHGLATRLYNDMEVGSYLMWRWWPRARVFQDPRINGYPDEMHAVLRRNDLGREAWQRFLDRFQVDAALLSYPDVNPRAAWFAPELWAVVYESADALVLARRTPAHAPLIAERELPITFTYTPETGTTAHDMAAPPPGSPVRACEWDRRRGERAWLAGNMLGALAAFRSALQVDGCLDGPSAAQARRVRGAVALQLGLASEALAALQGLPGEEERTNSAFALLLLGRAAEAAEAFAALARAGSADPHQRERIELGRRLARKQQPGGAAPP